MSTAAKAWLVAGVLLAGGGLVLLFRVLTLFDPHDPKGMR